MVALLRHYVISLYYSSKLYKILKKSSKLGIDKNMLLKYNYTKLDKEGSVMILGELDDAMKKGDKEKVKKIVEGLTRPPQESPRRSRDTSYSCSEKVGYGRPGCNSSLCVVSEPVEYQDYQPGND